MPAATPRSLRRSSRVSNITHHSQSHRTPPSIPPLLPLPSYPSHPSSLPVEPHQLTPLPPPTADAAKLRANATSGLSGKGTEAQKHSEVLAADAGARIDNALKDAKAGVSKIDTKLEGYRKEAETVIDQKTAEARAKGKEAADTFDQKVGEVSDVSVLFGGRGGGGLWRV